VLSGGGGGGWERVCDRDPLAITSRGVREGQMLNRKSVDMCVCVFI